MNLLTPKRFAALFVQLRNACETAIRLGVPVRLAKTEGAKLLSDRRVKQEIKRLDNAGERSLSAVRAGLKRLAFGQANDVAALVFSDGFDPQQLANADLFNVSEIKRVKGGGVEVKFFDRQKALEMLLELDNSQTGAEGARQFLNAVCDSAQGDISYLLNEKQQ